MPIIADFKENGLWAKGKKINSVYHFTKVNSRWHDMKKRCKEGSLEQRRHPSYQGCYVSDEFLNFQFFAEWCNNHPNYNKEGYQLDKDLLVKDNKVYGPFTCTFLPAKLNKLLIMNKGKRGNTPLGVNYCVRDKLFLSRMRIDNVYKHLGCFKNPADAFYVYKEEKEKFIKSLAIEFKNDITEKDFNALLNYKIHLED